MREIKIGIVGCGYWGKNLVRNFAELGALAALCDANKELAGKLAAQYKVPVLTFEELLQADLDGIVIAAPAVQHYTLAKQALTAGMHVFVEKPLSLNVEEAKDLCELAADKKLTLMVGHLLQYHPAFCKLKQLVTEEKLGKLQYVYSNRLNLGKFRNEENILWSFAPHDISMILGLVNDLPKSLHVIGSCHLNSHIQDVTVMHLSFRNNIRAHIFVSWLHPFKEQKLVVVGDQGMAVFDDGLPWEEKLQLYPHQVNWINGIPQSSKAEPIPVPLEPLEPLKLECEHFLDCIKTNHHPKTDGHEGVRVLQVLDAGQKSLSSGTSINLDDEALPYYKHETAFVDKGCSIGTGTKIWHFSHILQNTQIGENCIIGQNVMIGPDVIVGSNCKIQNNVSLYKGIVLEDGVFCGPSCVFTNVNNPRATIERKDEFRKTYVEKGVTIGANATIVCGNCLGAYSFIGAGAVVTKAVKPHALMVGNPARQIGWMSHAGEKLDSNLVCPRENRHYRINEDGNLEEIQNN